MISLQVIKYLLKFLPSFSQDDIQSSPWTINSRPLLKYFSAISAVLSQNSISTKHLVFALAVEMPALRFTTLDPDLVFLTSGSFTRYAAAVTELNIINFFFYFINETIVDVYTTLYTHVKFFSNFSPRIQFAAIYVIPKLNYFSDPWV